MVGTAFPSDFEIQQEKKMYSGTIPSDPILEMPTMEHIAEAHGFGPSHPPTFVETAYEEIRNDVYESTDALQARIRERAVTESEVKQSNPKDAIGSSKVPISTVSVPVLLECATLIRGLAGDVGTHPLSYISMPVALEWGLGMLEGAIKYRRHNYRVIGVRASVYYDATMRHFTDWLEGDTIDKYSGMSHLIKAATSLSVLRDAMVRGKMIDDRPPGTKGFMASIIGNRMPGPMLFSSSTRTLVYEALLSLMGWWENDCDGQVDPVAFALALLMLARDRELRDGVQELGAVVDPLNEKTKELLAKYETHEQPYVREEYPDDEYIG